LVAVFALSVADLHQHYRGAAPLALAVAFARVLTIVAAWWEPVAGVVASSGLALVTALLVTPVSTSEPWPWPVTGILAQLVVLLVAGTRYDGRRGPELAAGAWAVTQSAGVVALLARPEQGHWLDLVPMGLLSAAGLAVAGLAGSRYRVRVSLQLSEERARIARELHDVVAHHLSVVVVRADSAQQRLGTLDDAIAAEFAAIADDARASLEQMRRVLRLLRTEAAERAPQPGMADLGPLVAAARDAGAPITVSGLDGPPVDGLSGVTAYRVVQEAITNALRHAPGAPINLRLTRQRDWLVIRVSNPHGGRGAKDGHGLRGMRERVEAAGGTLAVTTGAEFRVEASLPL
jgi:signal transduction histidine kinase